MRFQLLKVSRPRESHVVRKAILVGAFFTGMFLGLLNTPAPTLAASPFFSPNFNPKVTVSASTYKAGANPDLVIRMKKPVNRCQPPILYSVPNQGELCDAAYIEQNLKDWTVHLPVGLTADPNATQQCSPAPIFTENDPNAYKNGYHCQPESKIGDIELLNRECFVSSTQWQGRPVDACYLLDGLSGLKEESLKGEVFNGVPGPGEQAHLYVLLGPETGFPPPRPQYYSVVRVDTSVKLRTWGDYGIDTITTNMPDAAPYRPGTALFQASVHDVKITLYGKGGFQKRPLITNPTSCRQRQLASTFTGYTRNSYAPDNVSGAILGSGIGLTVQDSVPHPVVGCNRLPFRPKLSLDLTPQSPGAPAGVTTTLTIPKGNQTTGEVKVRFPAEFKPNAQNTAAQCTDQDFQADRCPAATKIGRAKAVSHLLPKSQPQLSGDVFLGPTTSKDIKLFVDLKGFVDIKLKGSVTLNADGTSEATFTNLPELPVQSFTMSLAGGKGKALVTAPKTCGQKQVTAEFKSHQGKIVKRSIPVEISCTRASLDVQLGTRRPRAYPTVFLTAKAAGIRRATFTLSKFLKRRGFRKLDVGTTYGTVTFAREKGAAVEAKLLLRRRTRRGSLSFIATRGRTRVASGRIYKQRTGRRAIRTRSGRRIRSTRTRFSLTGIPQGTTQIAVELAGGKDTGLLRNPRRCKRRLGFKADIVGNRGLSYSPYASVKLRCKAKRRRGKRRSR